MHNKFHQYQIQSKLDIVMRIRNIIQFCTIVYNYNSIETIDF